MCKALAGEASSECRRVSQRAGAEGKGEDVLGMDIKESSRLG